MAFEQHRIQLKVGAFSKKSVGATPHAHSNRRIVASRRSPSNQESSASFDFC